MEKNTERKYNKKLQRESSERQWRKKQSEKINEKLEREKREKVAIKSRVRK